MNTQAKSNLPTSDAKDMRVRVGWRVRNAKGQIGIVTWKSEGCHTYKVTEPIHN